MADDTRKPPEGSPEDLSKEALNVRPLNVPFSGKQWRTTKPPESANMMEGGTANTAGGQAPEYSFANAWAMVEKDDFKDLAKKPCVRDSLMTGMGVGFGAGGLRAILGGRVWTSCNWAVGLFVLGSSIQYQYCLHQRRAEKEGMLRAIEVVNRKEIERKAREARREQVKTERRKAKDEEQDSQLASLREAQSKKEGKSSWKWW